MDASRRNDFREEEQLKRLLFARELDLLETLRSESHRLDRRVGDEPALTESVRRVIVDVLREADVSDHEQVAAALAPLVVETIRAEIRESRETLVDVLRPAAGRILWAGLGGGLRGAASGIEAVVSPSRWLARRRAERAHARFRLLRIVVVHRATGRPLVSVPETGTADRARLAGMLAAVSAFVRDTLPREREGEIRRIRFGDTDLHIRATPALVFATQGRGEPPAGFYEDLEDRFFDFLERWGPIVRDSGGALTAEQSRAIADDLTARFRPSGEDPAADGAAPAATPRFGYAVLGLIALLLVAWAGHAGWHAWRTHDVENRALAWIRGDPGLAPLPLGVAFASRENRLAAEGVVPDAESRDRLAQGLRRIAPADARIELRVAALGAAGGEADLGAAEEIAALERRLDALPDPDYLTMIAGWLARHPIRFADGDAYRDEELARQKLGAVAQLIEAWPLEFGVRVVGYSDADGSARANLASSAARAERVVADLVALGVPRDRLSAVGRGADKPVAPGTGPESGNRRVELELYLSR